MERIQPENNRTFNTGSGDWTGDITYNSGTHHGHQGYISVKRLAGDPTKNIGLAYPAIKPVPDKTNQLLFEANAVQIPLVAYVIDYTLSDGAHAYTAHATGYLGGTVWTGFGIAQTIPHDWNIPNTTIAIAIAVIEDIDAELAFDNFTLQVPTRIDHLPMVGIG